MEPAGHTKRLALGWATLGPEPPCAWPWGSRNPPQVGQAKKRRLLSDAWKRSGPCCGCRPRTHWLRATTGERPPLGVVLGTPEELVSSHPDPPSPSGSGSLKIELDQELVTFRTPAAGMPGGPGPTLAAGREDQGAVEARVPDRWTAEVSMAGSGRGNQGAHLNRHGRTEEGFSERHTMPSQNRKTQSPESPGCRAERESRVLPEIERSWEGF